APPPRPVKSCAALRMHEQCGYDGQASDRDAPAPPAGRGGVQALRSALREGRLSGGVHRALLPLRLCVRGARAHVHGLSPERVRGGDRRRHAHGGGTDSRRIRGGAGDPWAVADVRRGGAVDVLTARERARLPQSRVRRGAGRGADVPCVRAGRGPLARSRNRCRITTPTAGPAAARKNAARQLSAATAATTGGAPATTTPSSVCWNPSAAPVRAGPAASAAAA